MSVHFEDDTKNCDDSCDPFLKQIRDRVGQFAPGVDTKLMTASQLLQKLDEVLANKISGFVKPAQTNITSEVVEERGSVTIIVLPSLTDRIHSEI
jgi:hypothetical protein